MGNNDQFNMGNISSTSPIAIIDGQVEELSAQQEELAAKLSKANRQRVRVQRQLDTAKGNLKQSAQAILTLVETVGSAAMLRSIALICEDAANKAHISANAIGDDTEAEKLASGK